MGFLNLNWGDAAVGAVTTVGFMVGGPVGGAVAGALAGSVSAVVDGKGFGDILQAAAVEGALGAIPGGMVGGAVKGKLLRKGLQATAGSFKNAPVLFSKKFVGQRKNYLAEFRHLKLGATTAGVSTLFGNHHLSGRPFFRAPAAQPDPNAAKQPWNVPQIPTKLVYRPRRSA
ncbi:hypothetical protein ACWDOP_15085 [Nocardia sp. NPDC003693]